MITKELLDEVTHAILAKLPKDFSLVTQDAKKHLTTCIHSTLEKFDLLTREEFDIQVKALGRAEEKLAALSSKISVLEEKLS